MDIDDLLEFVDSLATDHKPEGWPAIQTQEVTALADEVKRLRAENEDLKAHVEYLMTECHIFTDKRLKELLEQRIIDLQGHDDLSYIDKKLSEQERVERLRAEKKQIYEDIKDAVEAKLKESNGGE